MIPIGDSVRSRSFPYVNVAIIVVNLLIFLYEVYLSGQTIRGNVTELDRFIAEWGNIPKCTFDAVGIGDPATFTEAQRYCNRQDSPVFTLLSAMFLHGSWSHVGFNMLFLWVFGDNVEDTLGHLRYLVFYLLTGVLAGLTHGAVNADSLTPAIGASGAIAGIMGAYLVLFPRARVTVIIFFLLPLPIPAFLLIGVWFVTQLLGGYGSLGVDAVGAGGGVAYFAHIGGFIAGAALVTVFALGRPRRRSSEGYR